MGDWWIDDAAPYGGPAEQLDLAQALDIYSSLAGRLRAALAIDISRAIMQATRQFSMGFSGHTLLHGYMDEMGQVYVSHLAEPGEIEQARSTPVEERPMTAREYALYAKKNRSTGPRSDWQFDRNGTKNY